VGPGRELTRPDPAATPIGRPKPGDGAGARGGRGRSRAPPRRAGRRVPGPPRTTSRCSTRGPGPSERRCSTTGRRRASNPPRARRAPAPAAGGRGPRPVAGGRRRRRDGDRAAQPRRPHPAATPSTIASGRPGSATRPSGLHKPIFRALQGKTQVVTPGQADFFRTRLTHAIELARRLGGRLACDPEVVEAAALLHDLGHSPFGHVGKEEFDRLREGGEAPSRDVEGYEGNAQSLGLATHAVRRTSTSRMGLDLTRAVLDAATKCPRVYEPSPDDAYRLGKYRFCPNAAGRQAFAFIRDGVAEQRAQDAPRGTHARGRPRPRSRPRARRAHGRAAAVRRRLTQRAVRPGGRHAARPAARLPARRDHRLPRTGRTPCAPLDERRGFGTRRTRRPPRGPAPGASRLLRQAPARASRSRAAPRVGARRGLFACGCPNASSSWIARTVGRLAPIRDGGYLVRRPGSPDTCSPDTWLVNAVIMPWRSDGAPGAPGRGCGSRGVRAASAR